jgi:hypothetical protein
VLDLVLHLVGDDLGLLARHRDHHHGSPPPSGLDEDGFTAWIDDLQVAWVAAARRISPRLAVELLGWAGPRLVATLGARGGAVTVTVSGPVAARWHLVASPGGWDFRPGPDPAAEVVATLDLTADECWRLPTNNLPPADQVRLRVAGDPAVAAVLLRTRAIIGMPQ